MYCGGVEMDTLKKVLNIVLIIAGIVFIVICGDFVSNRIVNTSFDKLEKLDQNAIDEMCQIISLFDDESGNNDVWDKNYNLRKIGCVIKNENALLNGRTYAVNVDLSKFPSAQKIEMPDKYSDIPVYRISLIKAEILDAEENSVMLGGIERVYTTYNESSVLFKGAGSLEEQYVKSTFEKSLETPDSPSKDISVSFEMDEDNIALTGLQYRIIDEMMNASSKDTLNELIAEYVAVRDYQAKMYPDFADQQQRIELIWGREQYVFYNISALIDHNMTYFNKEESEAINFYSAYHYLCTGHYNDDVSEFLDYKGSVYTGSALCEILEKNKIAKKWREKLDNSSNENFRSQYTLIKNYCDKNCGEYKKSVDDIKREYNYEEIIGMARALINGSSE